MIVEVMDFLAYMAWYPIRACLSNVLCGFEAHVASIVLATFIFFILRGVLTDLTVSSVMASHLAEYAIPGTWCTLF